MKNTTTVNCRKCKHFHITWDKNAPYGCKAMGFKGKALPSITVFKNSRKTCMLFEPKKEK